MRIIRKNFSKKENIENGVIITSGVLGTGAAINRDESLNNKLRADQWENVLKKYKNSGVTRLNLSSTNLDKNALKNYINIKKIKKSKVDDKLVDWVENNHGADIESSSNSLKKSLNKNKFKFNKFYLEEKVPIQSCLDGVKIGKSLRNKEALRSVIKKSVVGTGLTGAVLLGKHYYKTKKK